MNEKMKVNISTLSIVYLCLLFTLAYSGSINLYNSAVLLYILVGAYLTGAAIIPKKLNDVFSSFTHGLTAILTGSLTFSLAIFFTVNLNILLVIVAVCSFAGLWLNRRKLAFSFKLTIPEMVVTMLSFLLLLLISGSELRGQFSAVNLGSINGYDINFFTAIVASFRTGSLNNAAYETGSAVIYQDLGFFIPALWANLLKITSHQALWGLAQPLYKLLAILLGYEVFFAFFKDKVSRRNYFFMVAAISFPILLAPLHPLYVAKLNVHNFVFSGIAYLVPAGTITYPISIVTALLALLVFTSVDWKTSADRPAKLFFAVILGLMIIAKVPVYFAFFSFVGSVILMRIIFRGERLMRYLPYVVLSLVVTAISFKLCLSFPSLTKTSIHYGYMTRYFAHLYNRSDIGFKNNIIMLALLVVTYMVWLGIRLVGMVGLVRTKGGQYTDICIGAILSLVASTLVGLFLRIENFDVRGVLQRDGTFDVEQFVRSSFYIATIAGGIGLFNIIFNAERKKTRNIIAALSIIWCALVLTTLITYPAVKRVQDSWYADNYQTLTTGKLSDGLIVINPYMPAYGIMLSASDKGTYWSVMGLCSTGYNTYAPNAYRWDMYVKLISQPDEALLDAFKKEHVKYVVSVPADLEKLDHAAALFPQRVKKASYSKWVYELL